jgi:hypothetical protein
VPSVQRRHELVPSEVRTEAAVRTGTKRNVAVHAAVESNTAGVFKLGFVPISTTHNEEQPVTTTDERAADLDVSDRPSDRVGDGEEPKEFLYCVRR